MGRLSNFRERIRVKLVPPMADWLTRMSALRARRFLTAHGHIEVLVDNNLLAHATTHKTAKISLGMQKWGPHEFEGFTTARVSAYEMDSDSREFQSIKFLPGLISLHKSEHLSLRTSALLKFEQFYQPSGRFRGGGWFDHNLMGDVKLESVDGFAFPDMGPSWMELPSSREQLKQRLEREAEADADFASLVAVLGKKNSQDAWHIRTAEKHQLYCFLTTDFKLLDVLHAQRNSARVQALKTKVLTPVELAGSLGIYPIAPQLFSYTNASFPVRADLVMPSVPKLRSKKAD